MSHIGTWAVALFLFGLSVLYLILCYICYACCCKKNNKGDKVTKIQPGNTNSIQPGDNELNPITHKKLKLP